VRRLCRSIGYTRKRAGQQRITSGRSLIVLWTSTRTHALAPLARLPGGRALSLSHCATNISSSTTCGTRGCTVLLRNPLAEENQPIDRRGWRGKRERTGLPLCARVVRRPCLARALLRVRLDAATRRCVVTRGACRVGVAQVVQRSSAAVSRVAEEVEHVAKVC